MCSSVQSLTCKLLLYSLLESNQILNIYTSLGFALLRLHFFVFVSLTWIGFYDDISKLRVGLDLLGKFILL